MLPVYSYQNKNHHVLIESGTVKLRVHVVCPYAYDKSSNNERRAGMRVEDIRAGPAIKRRKLKLPTVVSREPLQIGVQKNGGTNPDTPLIVRGKNVYEKF